MTDNVDFKKREKYCYSPGAKWLYWVQARRSAIVTVCDDVRNDPYDVTYLAV